MKVYETIKVKNGYQVVWFWYSDINQIEIDAHYVENGFFTTEQKAKNYIKKINLYVYKYK
jgi:hypothetical protein